MLNPRMFFGLNTKTRKNVCCISNEEILYPVGSVIILHNFRQKSQRYIHLPNPEREISVITVATKKGYLAVAEKATHGEKPKIYIYDLKNLKRITTLGIPFEIDTKEFLNIIFTHDCHHIAALTAGPDYFMYYFNWKSGKIESQAKANNPPSVPGPVTDMAVNPKDATIVVFVGTSLFRLLSMSENVWRQYGFQKAQSFSILSVCWLTDDRVLAGCKDGKIVVVQSGDLNGVYDINEETEINVITTSESKKDQLKTLQRSLSKQMSSKEIREKEHSADIRCCTAITTGFLYSQKPGEVVYFQKTSKTSYKKCRTFVIKKDVLRDEVDYESLYYVNCICTNIDDTLLLCTTKRSQIYWTSLQEHKSEIVEFSAFEEPLHHGSIMGLSTCLWKPIFMTCGDFDNSVRIWNHSTMKIVLNQTFIETINCISLHPTGLYALIGFSDKVRFLLVLIHELQVYREFGVTDCKALAFSNNGHLFAAECNHDILVYSSITFQKVSHFQGHCQLITSLQWSINDLILYSSSTNGAIYEWSIEKNNRISDVVLRDVTVKGLVALKYERMICIDSEGNIKEIKNAKVISSKKLNHENGECLDFVTVLENFTCKLLLAGKNGVIISTKYPIEDEPNLNFFLMHNQRITQCCILDRGRSFVSADVDGIICIWDVTESVDEQPTIEKYFEEILVNTNELSEKNLNLNHLSCRIVEIVSEHSFEIKRKDDFYSNKIKQLEERYIDEIKSLKKRIKTLEKEHSMELNRIHLDITQMKQMHTSQMDQLDSNFNSRLLYEFQNYDKLKEEMKIMKNFYEKKMKEIECAKNTEDEMLKLHHQREVNDLQQQLIQLENTLVEERQQSQESITSLKSQLRVETESLKNNYEAKLKAESNKYADLKTELGITKKKLNIIQKEKEEFKSIKAVFDNEYEILKQKYNDAVSNIGKLKKEITEKEKNLEMEKKNFAETKRKIKDTMNGKAKLEDQLHTLEMQLEERKNQLETKEEEIYKLLKRIRREERGKAQYKTEIQRREGKLKSKDSLLQQCQTKIHGLKTRISNMQDDIRNLKDLIQEPEMLKSRVKEIHKKYSEKRQVEDRKPSVG